MQSFLKLHSQRIIGILNGFDRLVLRGRLRLLNGTSGMAYFLDHKGVRLTEFGDYAHDCTARLKAAVEKNTTVCGGRIEYVNSSRDNKEKIALKIAREEGIESGLITVISCLETCMSYDVYRDKTRKRIDLKRQLRKCLHYYRYQIDTEFGFMNARIQTWFPFDIQVCINGREWLAKKLDQARIGYRRSDNCFVWIEDTQRAQRLMDDQLKLNWSKALRKIARQLNPVHSKIFGSEFPLEYYWTVHQSEWATDLMFRDAAELSKIYPFLVQRGMKDFSSPDVMRFLGKRVFPLFQGEIISDFKNRPEGIRVKHSVGFNSIKIYDKAARVLRTETTINDPEELKVYRPKENDPNGQLAWRSMRKGIADIYRRAQYSQACNERYLEALAASIEEHTSITAILTSLSKTTSWNGYRVRGIHPWQQDDRTLLLAIHRGEFKMTGFKNSSLQQYLFTSQPLDRKEQKRRSAKTSRLLRMLRAHHLIKRIPSTYRYMLTERGTQILNALFSLDRITTTELAKLVA